MRSASRSWEPGRRRAHFMTVRGFRLHVADEAKAFSRKGADHDLILAAVADRPARRVDPARQRGFGDDAAIPDRLDQIVLGDDVVAVFDQVNQQVEDFRPNRNNLRPPGELPPVRVKHAVSEHKMHFGAPCPRAQTSACRQTSESDP